MWYEIIQSRIHLECFTLDMYSKNLLSMPPYQAHFGFTLYLLIYCTLGLIEDAERETLKRGKTIKSKACPLATWFHPLSSTHFVFPTQLDRDGKTIAFFSKVSEQINRKNSQPEAQVTWRRPWYHPAFYFITIIKSLTRK